MKSKITLLLLTLFYFADVFPQFDAQHPDLRLCGSAPNYYLNYYNCTSNNFTLNNVYLTLTTPQGAPITNSTCTVGVSQMVYVVLNYTSNGNNTPNNGRIFADLMVDQTLISINAYLGDIPPGVGAKQIYGPFLWTCGQELALGRMLVVWRTGGSNAQLASYNCSTYTTSQCELPPGMIVSKPLAVQYTYKACRVGNSTTVNYTSTTNGGIAPYQFAWDFDNNGTIDSTIANPTYTFTGASTTTKLRVTDSQGLVNNYIQTISSPTEMSLTAVPTHLSCSGSVSANGAIDLSVTGGTAGYTYLWSNGATSQDISGLLPGMYTVTVTDVNNCQKTLQVQINGGDTANPIVTAPANVTIQGCNSQALAANGMFAFSSSQSAITVAQFTQAGGSYTDASSIATITYQDVQTGNCPKIITRTFRVTDACGNMGTAVQTITVQDTVPPMFEPLVASYEIYCPATPVFDVAKAIDDCDNYATLTYADVTTPGSCLGNYSVKRTWTATDACGNVSTASQTIYVKDTTGPVIEPLPGPTTIYCPALPQFAQVVVTDACGSFTLSSTDSTTTTCEGTYSITRTWTATDSCGNTTTASQTINVIDNTPPVFADLPAPSTISCPAVPSFTQPVVTDACCTTVTLTFADQTTPGSCGASYSVTRTWTATDDCGNSSTATQTIHVVDDTAPVFAALPPPSTIPCHETPQFAQAVVTDACGSSFTLTSNDVTTTICMGTFTTVRTWTATDACGNVSTATQTITSEDTVPPVISELPGPTTISCPETPVFATPTATDACCVATLTFEDIITPGSCTGTYTIVRQWNAVDMCGNQSSASQTITVIDNTAPVISTPAADLTVECGGTGNNPSLQTWLASNGGAHASDTCSDVTWSNNFSTMSGDCSASVTVTFTATDSCGNSASTTATFSVQDVTAPVVPTAPATVSVTCASEIPANVTLTATDNCNGAISVQGNDVTTPGSCSGSFVIVRTWTFTDSCGNTSSVSQTINVNDNIAPTVPSEPEDIILACASEIPAMISLTATDNCGEQITVQGVDQIIPGSCPGTFGVLRTWIFTDSCGNTSSVSQNINVKDNTPPTAPQAPADVTLACGSEVPAMVSLTAIDDCGEEITVTGVDVTTQGSCSGSYVIVRTWTFTDSCDNTSSVSQTINVNDNIAPTLPTAPADVTLACGSEVPAMVSLTAMDNCGGEITVAGVDATTPGSCSGSYVIVRSWTFTDACGNTSSVSQTINVNDTVAPTLPTAPADVTLACGSEVPAMISLTAMDNCGGEITVAGVDVTTPGSCSGSYVIVRTWTFADACGNTSSVSQTINVNDTVAPTLPTAPADVTLACESEVPAMVSLTAMDNCGGEITVAGVDVTTPGSCLGSFVIVRTWTFADACGNSSSVSQTINVNDTVAPTLPTAPADITLACGSEVPAMVSLTAMDNCGGEITVTGVDVTTPGSCSGSYVIVRTWTFADACGNTSSVSQTINVNDTTAPTLPTAPADVMLACGSEVPAMISLTAMDNCGGEITVEGADVTTPGSCSGSFVIVRTWTFTDACGNTSSVSQTINVNDNVAPVITELPQPSTINCPQTPEFATATATDNCGTATLTFEDITTPGSCAGSYTVVRTWTATDICGNTTTASQTINVQDITAPTYTAPANVTLSAGADCTADITPATTGTVTGISDSCDPNPTATYVDTTCFGNSVDGSVNAGNGNYFYFNVSGLSDLTANNIAQVALQFQTNQGKGRAEFTLVSPSGQAIVLVGPYCTGGFCEDASANTQENYQPVFYPSSSGFTQYNNNNFIPTTVPQNFIPNGTLSSPNAGNITGVTSYVSSFEQLTGPMNGQWFIYARKQQNVNGNVTFQGVCLTPATDCANDQIIIRHWTVSDACNNTAEFDQVITISDTTPPVFNGDLPQDLTVECGSVPTAPVLTATDNCGPATVTFTETTANGSCAGASVITRTWTATDVCGNASTHVQTITVQDTTAPVISELPATVTLTCPATPEFATATATDSCGSNVTLTFEDVTTPGECAGSYSITRTWTAVDACGNTATATQTINVEDTTAPVITTQASDITVECSGQGNGMTVEQWLADNGGAVATDTCSDVVWTNNFSSMSSDCSAAVTVIFTATDACGNASTTTATFMVQDITAPVAPQAPADINIACEGEVPANVTLTATDNCSGTISAQGVDVTTSGSCAGSFTIVRTWTFTDACGNSSSVSQTINVNDNIPPVAPQAPADVNIACEGEVPAMVSLTAVDNCGGEITVEGVDVTTPGTCTGSFVTIRTWTFTDACGNTSSVSQTINANDNVPPVAPQAPADVNIACEGEVPAMVSLTAVDNCGGEITVEGVDVTTPGICTGSFVTIRTWTFTDACGNTSSVSQTINANDNVPPVAPQAPADVNIACEGEVPAMVSLTAVDNCGGEITVEGVDVTTPGTCTGSFVTIRTWTFTDACGNTSSVSQTINANDNVPPVAPQAPADLSFSCAGEVPAMVSLTAVDNCNGEITVAGVDATTQGTCAGSFVTVRTWTFTDNCGNTSSVSQTITVQDTTAPVISELPATATLACPATVEFATPTATDNCGGEVNLTFEDVTTPGECANSYSITRTWTAVDACGNTATATQTINVEDTTAPVITTQASDITVECSGQGNGMTVEQWLANNGGAVATDTCSDVVWTNNFSSMSSDCSAAVTVIFTATDACGNASTTTATFTVQDVTAPVAPQAPADINIACEGEIPANVTLTATDNCSGTISAQGVDATTPGSCAGSFTIVRTWTFTDSCGNSSSVTQTINVKDVIPPVAPQAPADVNIVCEGEVPPMISLTATDNCGGEITVTGVDTTTPGTCSGSFTIVRTWTFTDACGNTTSVSQNINANDNVPPVAPQAPADVTVSCAGDVPANVTLTSKDDCSGSISAEGVDVITPGACANSFVIVRTWTFADVCGNTTTVSQTITVNDDVAPVAPQAPADVTFTCTGEIPPMISLTATDNCGEQITVMGVDSTVAGTCVNSQVTTRTWTFTDACGNSSSVSQTITISDDIAPLEPTKVPEDMTLTCGDNIPANVTLFTTDNCGGEMQAEGVDTIVAGSCPNSYVIIRTWTFTDACGNTTSVTQTITVDDNVAPAFVETAPADISVSCDAIPAAATLTATDNCNTSVAVTFNEQINANQGGCAGSYNIVRTWTATDACGNIATATQTITVEDVDAPVFDMTAPADVTVTCDTIPDPATLTASDNCGTATVTMSETSVTGTCPITSVITRTWTATDTCGNATSVSQIITVTDTTGPTIDGDFQPVINSTCALIPNVPQLTFVDTCSTVGEAVFTETIIDQTDTAYTIIREWIVADACGNQSTFTQTVFVSVSDSVVNVPSEICSTDISVIDLNTLLPAGTATGGTWVDLDNSGGLTGSNFTAIGVALGTYTLQYQLTGNCPQNVNINMEVNEDCIVEPCGAIFVHNAFSPNNDGINEHFAITSLEEFDCYPTNTVEIYNRWGVLVYETKQYDNAMNSFRGISEGRATVNKGAELPTGTYFYLLQYTTTDGQVVKKDGYLYLSR